MAKTINLTQAGGTSGFVNSLCIHEVCSGEMLKILSVTASLLHYPHASELYNI